MNEFKLFIWDDPYHVSFGSSYLVVAARDLDEAKKVAATSENGRWSHMGIVGERLVLGNPSRVKELPYGEFQEWSE